MESPTKNLDNTIEKISIPESASIQIDDITSNCNENTECPASNSIDQIDADLSILHKDVLKNNLENKSDSFKDATDVRVTLENTLNSSELLKEGRIIKRENDDTNEDCKEKTLDVIEVSKFDKKKSDVHIKKVVIKIEETPMREVSGKEELDSSSPTPTPSSDLSVCESSSWDLTITDSRTSEEGCNLKLENLKSDEKDCKELLISDNASSLTDVSNLDNKNIAFNLPLSKTQVTANEAGDIMKSKDSCYVSNFKREMSSNSSSESLSSDSTFNDSTSSDNTSTTDGDTNKTEDAIFIFNTTRPNSNTKLNRDPIDCKAELKNKDVDQKSPLIESGKDDKNKEENIEINDASKPLCCSDSAGLNLSLKKVTDVDESNCEMNVLSTNLLVSKDNCGAAENVAVLEIARENKKEDLSSEEKTELCNGKESPSGEKTFNVPDTNETTSDAVTRAVGETILSDEETGFPEIFRGLVTRGKYLSVRGDFTLRSSDALVESPSLVAPFLLKEPDTFIEQEDARKPQNGNFFASSVGKFLEGLGLSRVKESFHRDMMHIKSKQLRKVGKLPEHDENFKMHQSQYIISKNANKPYTFPDKSCTGCKFTSESSIVLEGHMLAPHYTLKREYQCNYCSHSEKEPKNVLGHMKTNHKKVGYLLPPSLLYECSNCVFECHSRPRLLTHMIKCSKYFKSHVNQAPPKNFEYPCLTPKPITVAVVKSFEKIATLSQMRNKKKPITAERYQQPKLTSDGMFVQSSTQSSNFSYSRTARKGMKKSHTVIQNVSISDNRGFQSTNPVNTVSGGHFGSLQLPFSLNPIATAHTNQQNRNKGQTTTVLLNPPRLQGPYPVPVDSLIPSLHSPNVLNTLVVCEICDGYIKDMEQLRAHMQLIHKVKIHPKVFSSRPPLNCQKCQWRFFTDQGLERHLLGAHGLVTSNMQDLSNTGMDAGCCTICGRVFASKLVLHMSQVHKITLKPAHLSYKCTVCSSTFGLYRLFENHVYLVHSNASKRSSECAPPSSSKRLSSSLSALAGKKILPRRKRRRTSIDKTNGST